MNLANEYVTIAHVTQKLPNGLVAHFVGRVVSIVDGGARPGSLTLTDIHDDCEGEWAYRIGMDGECLRLDWQEVPLVGCGLPGEAPGTEDLKWYHGGHVIVFSKIPFWEWGRYGADSILSPPISSSLFA